MARSFTKLLNNKLPIEIPSCLLEAHFDLIAKRKLNLILKSKAPQVPPIKVADLIQVYIKLRDDKRGKWTSPRVVLNVHNQTGTVTVPGSNGKVLNAAYEDIRICLLYTSPSPRDQRGSRMPSSA